jgi:demethylmenaquinone methyltransferase/2-methoxy-6-polyprenyl-1,4-benzoquinol methylase
MDKGVRKIFSALPDTYELVNRVLTLGLDVVWRRKAARIASSHGGKRWLDVCSGTGETAVYLRRLAGRETSVYSVDFCPPMLEVATMKKEAEYINFAVADAARLPFRDASLDLVTISFATRNLNVNVKALETCMREFKRVLRAGGRFVNLETSQPPSPFLRKIYHSYVGLVVRPLGRLLSGSDPGYAYLSHTIPRFYPADELASLIQHAGFSSVSFRRLLGGTFAIHEAVK